MDLSGLHILDLGKTTYNMDVVYAIVEITLFLAVIVSFFVFWQINRASAKLRDKKCVGALHNLIDALYIIGFLLLVAIIGFSYIRMAYKVYLPIELTITLLILGLLTDCLLVKAMVAFSPEKGRRKRKHG
jgi:hypothetical protein